MINVLECSRRYGVRKVIHISTGGAVYGEPTTLPELRRLAARQFADDGIPASELAVVGGALDGIERVLQAHLRPGDRVAVEDPGHTAVLDLLPAMGLLIQPVRVDDSGPDPDDLARVLRAGVQACVLTPRAQNQNLHCRNAFTSPTLTSSLVVQPDFQPLRVQLAVGLVHR